MDAWIISPFHDDHVDAFNEIYADPGDIEIGKVYTPGIDPDMYMDQRVPVSEGSARQEGSEGKWKIGKPEEREKTAVYDGALDLHDRFFHIGHVWRDLVRFYPCGY